MDLRTRIALHSAASAACVFVALAFVVGCGSVQSTSVSQHGDPNRDGSVSPDPGAGRVADAGAPQRQPADTDAHHDETLDTDDGGFAASVDAGATWIDACGHRRPDAFADSVVSFTPGPSAGFGAKNMPCVVLGAPMGAGTSGGSTDVVSLGNGGSIVLEFEDVELTDGPGPDLLVFENAFPGWVEPGFVAVSADGKTWSEWPCEPQNSAGGYPHCAGVAPVFSNPTNGISPTDPTESGGDVFDLADVGVTSAKFVRIRDSGFSKYSGVSGGFDLDAIAAVHSVTTSTDDD